MLPRVPIPRLTLFTGGKECSLCEVAKQELAILRKSTPFDLTYWNIRDPPTGADEWEVKKWRRAYQYDIVARFAPRRQEGAETSYKSTGVTESSGGMAGQSSEQGVGIGESSTPSKFKPYTSILSFSTAPIRDDPSPPPSKKRKLAPWRRAVGRAHFALDIEVERKDEDGFAEMMEWTFSECSDEIIGSDIPIIDFAAKSHEADWEIDGNPGPQVPGEQGVLYDLAEDIAPPTITKNGRACWNCGSLHHELIDCPHRRDQVQINLSRAIFTTQKDQMPEYALPFLQNYTFDAEERERRLDLLTGFRPGYVSEELLDAVFHVDEEMTREEEEQIEGWRRRGYYPWYQWMMKWGYPPGWIAGRDPLKVLRQRLENMPLEKEDDDFTNGADMLKVFGGHMEEQAVPPSPTSSDMSLDDASSDGTMVPKSPIPVEPASPPPPPSHDLPPLPSSPPPPPPPPDEPPPVPPPISYPQVRWAYYDTDLFDTDRLMAFTTARPLPLGH